MTLRRVERERRVTLLLGFICFCLICGTVAVNHRASVLRLDVEKQSVSLQRQQDDLRLQKANFQKQQKTSYEACGRGNVMREQMRYMLTQLGAVDRAQLPEIAEQNCARLYPKGAPR